MEKFRSQKISIREAGGLAGQTRNLTRKAFRVEDIRRIRPCQRSGLWNTCVRLRSGAATGLFKPLDMFTGVRGRRRFFRSMVRRAADPTAALASIRHS